MASPLMASPLMASPLLTPSYGPDPNRQGVFAAGRRRERRARAAALTPCAGLQTSFKRPWKRSRWAFGSATKRPAAASAHPMRVASGGGFPGGGDKRPPGDGRQSPQPVRRQQTPRRYAHERHFLNQTVGPGEVEIFVVIVEAGPPDIIDETLRGNAAIGQNDLVVLKLHMPPDEARRHLRKRREADRGSVLSASAPALTSMSPNSRA